MFDSTTSVSIKLVLEELRGVGWGGGGFLEIKNLFLID